MEKIRLIDGSVHEVTRAEITNGRLEVDFQGRDAEELQDTFSVPALLTNIELLTENEEKIGDVPGWTVYGGVSQSHCGQYCRRSGKDHVHGDGDPGDGSSDGDLRTVRRNGGVTMNSMAKVYATLVRKGEKTIDQVPEKLMAEVRRILNQESEKVD